MSPPRAVLFDLDGTLVDSLADIGTAMNAALSGLGHPTHPLTDYRDWLGGGVSALASHALPKNAAAQAQVDDAVAAFRQYYAAHLVDFTRPYPGIESLLAELRGRDVRLAVLSNKLHPTTCGIVERLFPRGTFDLVYGERPGIPKKPHPAGALEIARQLELEPAACAFVGDTWFDMATACAAGMVPVGVTWGFRDEAEVREHGARHVVHHADELTGCLFP